MVDRSCKTSQVSSSLDTWSAQVSICKKIFSQYNILYTVREGVSMEMIYCPGIGHMSRD